MEIKIELIRGLVRPVISILLVGTVVFLSIKGKIDPKEIITIVGMIIAFHFGERAATKRQIRGEAPPPVNPQP